jgi:hypothetical protein
MCLNVNFCIEFYVSTCVHILYMKITYMYILIYGQQTESGIYVYNNLNGKITYQVFINSVIKYYWLYCSVLCSWNMFLFLSCTSNYFSEYDVLHSFVLFHTLFIRLKISFICIPDIKFFNIWIKLKSFQCNELISLNYQ